MTSLSPEEMASTMTSLGVNVNNTLQQVTSRIIEGRNTLADLERACEAKKSELENLFGQDVVARTIGNLLADHDAKKKEFAAKEEEMVEAVARQEAVNERQQQEWDRQFAKDCERARTNFNYEFEQNKRTQSDALGQQLQAERRSFDEAQRDRDRINAENEADIVKRLQAVAEKEALVEGAVEAARKKVEAEKAIALNSMKREHEHTLQIVAKDAETQKQIADSTINNLKLVTAGQKTEIEALKAQLSEAQTKNTELAKSALDSASRSFALDAVMQQSDNNGSGRPTRGKA